MKRSFSGLLTGLLVLALLGACGTQQRPRETATVTVHRSSERSNVLPIAKAILPTKNRGAETGK